MVAREELEGLEKVIPMPNREVLAAQEVTVEFFKLLDHTQGYCL
jgi:hypothetical protein